MEERVADDRSRKCEASVEVYTVQSTTTWLKHPLQISINKLISLDVQNSYEHICLKKLKTL